MGFCPIVHHCTAVVTCKEKEMSAPVATTRIHDNHAEQERFADIGLATNTDDHVGEDTD